MRHQYSDFVDKIDIDALEQYLGFEPLYHRNGNDIGYCIWPENHSHGDTTGKFAIHRDKKVYSCWVCGGGSLLSLIKRVENCNTDEATEILYRLTVDVDDTQEAWQSRLKARLDAQNEPPPEKTPLPYFNPRVLDQFDGPRDYFYERGFSDEIIDRYRLCTGEASRGTYVGPAAIFPHFWQGRLVGWQCRWIGWHKGLPVPKYTNTRGFPRHETIFNLDAVLDDEGPLAVGESSVVVVESVPTTLLLATYQIPAVATFGDNVTAIQARFLRGFPSVILVPDNDLAGLYGYERLAEELDRYTQVYMAEPVGLKPNADLADYLETDSPEEMILAHLVEKVTPWGFANRNK